METYDFTNAKQLPYHDFETPVSAGIHSLYKPNPILDMMNSERDSGVATGSQPALPASMLGARAQTKSIVEEMQDRNDGPGRESTQFMNPKTFAGAIQPIDVFNPEARYDLVAANPYDGSTYRTMHAPKSMEPEQGGSWRTFEPNFNPFVTDSDHSRKRVTKSRTHGDPDPGFAASKATSHQFGVTQAKPTPKGRFESGGIFQQVPSGDVKFNQFTTNVFATRPLAKPTKELTGPYLPRGSDSLRGSAVDHVDTWVKPLPLKNTRHLTQDPNWIMQAPTEVTTVAHEHSITPRHAMHRDNSSVLDRGWMVSEDVKQYNKTDRVIV